ncbi:XAC2610-related protein [Pseudomonas luteola]
MKYLYAIIILLIAQHSHALECKLGNTQLKLEKCKNQVCIFEGKNIHTLDIPSNSIDQIKCRDVNFDGKLDILVEQPPSGRTQETKVYLFNKEKNEYIFNESISKLPCLSINKKEKTVSGSCFTSSACDRWSEKYSVFNYYLKLIEVEGTYCDPASGQTYKYIEKYDRKGHQIYKNVEEINE